MEKLDKITIYPIETPDGTRYGCLYGDKRGIEKYSKTKLLSSEEMQKIKQGTYTAINQILEEFYLQDEDTDEIFKVHFGVSRLTDILNNNN